MLLINKRIQISEKHPSVKKLDSSVKKLDTFRAFFFRRALHFNNSRQPGNNVGLSGGKHSFRDRKEVCGDTHSGSFLRALPLYNRTKRKESDAKGRV